MMYDDPPQPPARKLRATPAGHITCRTCAGTRAKTCSSCDSFGRERATLWMDDGRLLRLGDVVTVESVYGHLALTIVGFSTCMGHESDDTASFGLHWPTVCGELHEPGLVDAEARERLRNHGIHTSLLLRSTHPHCST